MLSMFAAIGLAVCVAADDFFWPGGMEPHTAALLLERKGV
jgi:hypothetical protein